MTISLTPEQERLTQELVDSGKFKDSAEVVGEALRLIEERERVAKVSDADYQEKKKRFLARMEKGFDLGTNGVIAWTRDEIHER